MRKLVIEFCRLGIRLKASFIFWCLMFNRVIRVFEGSIRTSISNRRWFLTMRKRIYKSSRMDRIPCDVRAFMLLKAMSRFRVVWPRRVFEASESGEWHVPLAAEDLSVARPPNPTASRLHLLFIIATPVQSRPSVVFELTGGWSHCSRPPASRRLRAGGAFFSLTSRACAVESQTWAADGIRAELHRWIVTCSPVLCAL